MIFLKQYFRKYCTAVFCVLACSQLANAQTDADAIMIPRGYFCAGAMYSNANWTEYWEGTFKRNNLNIGTFNTNMYSLMGNYGLTDNINILASLPYVTTHASAGTLEGFKGIQDFMLTVKWRVLKDNFAGGKISFFAIGSASKPASNYSADELPMSIGLHASVASLRLMGDYQANKFFVTGSGEYDHKSDITLDRNSYYTTQLYYTNKVFMPDAADFGLRTGYRSSHWIAEVVAMNYTTLGGFDIRKNDMPFPSNRMNWTSAGVNFKYSFSSIRGLEITAGGDQVLTGRNVGQSTIIHGGLFYLFSLTSKSN